MHTDSTSSDSTPNCTRDHRVFIAAGAIIKHEALILPKCTVRFGTLNTCMAMIQPVWNFEQEPYDEPADETAINLRAYFDRMPDEKMRQYSADWDDDRVVDWDGEFRDDGNLMIACCERDVDVKEYRRVLEQCIRYRERVRRTVER